MKKIFILLCTIFILSGCGKSGPPKDMDSDTYTIGVRALAVCESYEKGVIDKNEYYEKINDLLKQAQAISNDDMNATLRNLDVTNALLNIILDLNANKVPTESVKALRKAMSP